MREIGIQDVDSVTLEGDMVVVRVTYESDDVFSSDNANPHPVVGKRIVVRHEQPLRDRFIANVVSEAVQEAIDKAYAALAGWDMAAGKAVAA